MSDRSKTHASPSVAHEGLHNDFSEQEILMGNSRMPPPFKVEVSAPGGGDGRCEKEEGGDGLLWLLQATWNSGDPDAFWRLLAERREDIIRDGNALHWLRMMNESGAFASQGKAVPQPLLEMAAESQDNTATGLPAPKLLELPKVEITAYSLAPPERPYWRLLHRDGSTDYHFAQRGTTFFIVAETAINSGASAYHYLTFDRPEEWKEFFPRDRNFNMELKEAVLENMQLLQFAELVAEEGVWMIFGAATEMIEFGRLVALAGAGRKAAKEGMEEGAELATRKAAKGSVEEIAERTPLPPRAEGTEAPARELAEEALGGSAESATHTVGPKGAIGPERATRMRSRMWAKVGGNPKQTLRFSDAELADFLNRAEQLGFGEPDIEAILSMKVRLDSERPWTVSLENLSKVAESLAVKSQNHKIAFKEGWDFMKVYRDAQEKMLKEGKPLDPKEYLEDWYIDQHLKDFEEEASYLITGSTYKQRVEPEEVPHLGRDDGQYISTSREITRVLEKAQGDISIVERELGIPAGDWQDKNGLYRIDVLQPTKLELRLPNGFEKGANEFWHPGGVTAGGAPEAVVNQIPKNAENYRFTPLKEFD